MTHCHACQATTTNGLTLCEQCQIKLTIHLEWIPIYHHNLTRWTPTNTGPRPVPASHPPPGAFPTTGDPITRTIDEVETNLTSWLNQLNKHTNTHTPTPAPHAATVHTTCLTLTQHLTTIATHTWAAELLHQLTHHETQLRTLTQKVAPGWYAGACTICQHPTHVIPGLTWVTCNTCGATTYARDHLDTILEEARDWIDRPMRLAEATVALLNTETSIPRLHKRISKWGERGPTAGGIATIRHTDHDGDPTGPKLYRFGDVLDRVRAEHRR